MIIQKIKDLVAKLNTNNNNDTNVQEETKPIDIEQEVPNITNKFNLTIPELSLMNRQANTKILELKEELTEQSRKAATRIATLEEENRTLIEDKKTILAEIEKEAAELRREIIKILTEGIYLDEGERNERIESFYKSRMSYSEIGTIMQQFREAKSYKQGTGTTKLPQKSVPYH